jgi:hydrogenase nickel incorporation protein HypA/HybF
MHEVSIVQALVEQVEAEVRQAGCGGRVLKLDLVIGRFSGIHPDSIRFAFEILTPDTLLAGARLEIREPPGELLCQACGARTAIDELTLECPRCGSGQVTVEGGQEMLLQSIEVEDEAPSDKAPPGERPASAG